MSFKSKQLQIFILLFLTVAVISGAQSSGQPKNIIMMIGDGMGVAHITAAKIENGHLNLERCKVMGLHLTSSADNPVTDSAAAGTALATGYKTNNDVLGLCPDGQPLKNLLEYAQDKNKATGLVVTSILPHATPAAFSTHVKARYQYDSIVDQQVNSGIDVMFGGGWNNFYPKSFSGSRRKDNRNLMLELRRKMPVVTTFASLQQATRVRQLSAILAGGHLPLASERNYTLGDLTEKAISILEQNPRGFVLMIEGSQIDLAAHRNNMAQVIGETIDFDTAIKTALDFAEKDGNTLVVITADHETGGITLPFNSIEGNRVVAGKFSTDNHTAAMVPIFAHGPGAERFAGIQTIDQVGQKLIELVKKDDCCQ